MKLISPLVLVLAFSCASIAQSCPSCTGTMAVTEDSGTGIVAPVSPWVFNSSGTTLTGASGTMLDVGTIESGTAPSGGVPGFLQNTSQTYVVGTSSLVNGSCIGPGCAPSLPNIYPGLTVFGDSGACGYGATPTVSAPGTGFGSPYGYAFIMAPDFGGAFINYCNGGDWSEDLVREWAMPFVSPTDSKNPTYVVEIGGDEAIGCNYVPTCINNFTYALQAAVAWLAIPTSCKVYGQSTAATSGGTVGLGCGVMGPPVYQPANAWGPDNFTNPSTPFTGGSQTHQPVINGVAEFTLTPGATATIPITTTVPNQNVYCGWHVVTAENSSQASFAIASVSRDTWVSQFYMPPAYSSPYLTGLSTPNGSTDSIFVRYYPISTAGPHTLLITALPGTGSGGGFSFAWCGVAPQSIPVPQPQATPLSISSASASSGGTTVYNGTITGGASNALVGKWFFVAGFTATSPDNGQYLCTASTATTLTLLNGSGTAESASATATPGATQSAYEAGQPRVLMSGVLRQKQAGNNASDATTLLFDNAAQTIAQAFAEDGLQVSIAQIRTYINYANNIDYTSGGLHPSNIGYQHVRDAFEAAVANGFGQSKASAPVGRSCGAFTTSAATSDTYLCPSVTATSKCSFEPTNSTAAGLVAGLYISSKTGGSLTVNHSAIAGGTFDVVCTQN